MFGTPLRGEGGSAPFIRRMLPLTFTSARNARHLEGCTPWDTLASCAGG